MKSYYYHDYDDVKNMQLRFYNYVTLIIQQTFQSTFYSLVRSSVYNDWIYE